MGLITGGRISGFLPDLEAFSVHYPGYPSSTSRAIETLGGTEGILKTRSSKSNYLELHFRPEDPYSHPAFGELRQCSSLLLKISKKKDAVTSENRQTPLSPEIPNLESVPGFSESRVEGQQLISESDLSIVSEGNNAKILEEESPVRLCAAIVARVPQAYYFEGMVDYQHVLAVHADVARKRKRQWTEVETHFEKGGLMDIDQEDLMFLVPPLFTSKDMPENLVLNPSVSLNSKLKQQAVVRQHWEMNIEPCLAIDFNIEEVPKKINWEDNIPHGSPQWVRQMAISKLFEERPIWPRYSVHQRLIDDGVMVSDDQMKRLLFRMGYYFSTGPFGRFWIRKGYDPRKDPESRIYQRVDFRLPPCLRSYGGTEGSNYAWKDICQFRAFPSKSFISLQFFELDDDYIQEEIRKPLRQMTFTRSTGWFSGDLFRTLMLRVSMRFLSIFPRSGAEALLQSVSERFEKCKTQQSIRRNLKSNEKENQHVGTGSSSHDSEVDQTSHIDMEAIGDDDDEIEDDEDEEQFNEYQGEGDDGFPLQPCSYPIGENINQDYLQQIFGILPFPKDGTSGANKGIAQDADASDGEYQIYEQDSDDYYDGNDDGGGT
eukprot:TRINITY_DN6909_c1_g2_i9.p1 TRINITY_DN6909_c1_g2~~TRINITY_DN6909_c1_g2_i9.p1  ORF type:complete len:601 (+),score=127.53 TRINITY_DN6909_c1_g2_i9:334-2136(+)